MTCIFLHVRFKPMSLASLKYFHLFQLPTQVYQVDVIDRQ